MWNSKNLPAKLPEEFQNTTPSIPLKLSPEETKCPYCPGPTPVCQRRNLSPKLQNLFSLFSLFRKVCLSLILIPNVTFKMLMCLSSAAFVSAQTETKKKSSEFVHLNLHVFRCNLFILPYIDFFCLFQQTSKTKRQEGIYRNRGRVLIGEDRNRLEVKERAGLGFRKEREIHCCCCGG